MCTYDRPKEQNKVKIWRNFASASSFTSELAWWYVDRTSWSWLKIWANSKGGDNYASVSVDVSAQINILLKKVKKAAMSLNNPENWCELKTDVLRSNRIMKHKTKRGR